MPIHGGWALDQWGFRSQVFSSEASVYFLDELDLICKVSDETFSDLEA